MSRQSSFRDLEQLSAYLDGQLSAADSTRLESQIESNPELRSLLEELRRTRSVLRALPSRRAPRNFTLSPKMVGQKPPLPRSYPALRFATALASFLLLVAFATNVVAPLATRQLAAAPEAYGLGGGPAASDNTRPQSGGGCDGPDCPTEAPAIEAPAAPSVEMGAVTPTPQPDNQQQLAPQATRPALAAPKESGNQFAQPTRAAEPAANTPSPSAWLIALAVIVVLGLITTWLVQYFAARKWRNTK
jgi:hypothetical protein